MKYSMRRPTVDTASRHPERAPASSGSIGRMTAADRSRQLQAARYFIGQLVVEAVLDVLEMVGDGVEDIVALRILHDVLQIEVLDRDMVVAELEVAAHRLEVGLLHLLAHLVFFGKVAFHRTDCAVDQAAAS